VVPAKMQKSAPLSSPPPLYRRPRLQLGHKESANSITFLSTWAFFYCRQVSWLRRYSPVCSAEVLRPKAGESPTCRFCVTTMTNHTMLLRLRSMTILLVNKRRGDNEVGTIGNRMLHQADVPLLKRPRLVLVNNI
jgi:hypothetical protein